MTALILAYFDSDLEYVDRKSTRLNSSHRCISYAVFCLKKKKDILFQVLASPDVAEARLPNFCPDPHCPRLRQHPVLSHTALALRLPPPLPHNSCYVIGR